MIRVAATGPPQKWPTTALHVAVSARPLPHGIAQTSYFLRINQVALVGGKSSTDKRVFKCVIRGAPSLVGPCPCIGRTSHQPCWPSTPAVVVLHTTRGCPANHPCLPFIPPLLRPRSTCSDPPVARVFSSIFTRAGSPLQLQSSRTLRSIGSVSPRSSGEPARRRVLRASQLTCVHGGRSFAVLTPISHDPPFVHCPEHAVLRCRA